MWNYVTEKESRMSPCLFDQQIALGVSHCKTYGDIIQLLQDVRKHERMQQKLTPFLEKTLKRIADGEQVTIWCDIDGTLCDTESGNYENAEPDYAMITLLNMLYDLGCNVFIVTARGSTSGYDWEALTKKQLGEWGVQYHRLMMGTPKDLYIGDETMQPEMFLNSIGDFIIK